MTTGDGGAKDDGVSNGGSFPMWAFVVALGAALAFPVVAVAVHRKREHARNRRAGRRRNDRISL